MEILNNKQWNSREKVIDFLEDYSSNLKEQINSQKTKHTLLKSYIFETFDESIYEFKNIDRAATSIQNLFNSKEHEIHQIDEKMFYMLNANGTIGFFEQINDRFCILYSLDNADSSNKFVRNTIRNSSILDSLWISGKMFDELLIRQSKDHNPNRFTKIKFEFDSFFENLKYMQGNDIKVTDNDLDYDERKVSSVSLVEEVGDIVQKIEGVRQYFSSFHSIGSLRFPSSLGKGGHDFYQNGKVTNRSDSFKDHRFQIKKLIKSYQGITEFLEEKTWVDFEHFKAPNKQYSYNFEGSPVTIIFKKPLKEAVYQNFIKYTFPKGKDPFRIFGEVIQINENRHHIYGIDLHLWQKVMLDLSKEQFTVFLPKGTCGNTIHRIVTNIQRYLDPELSVYIGNTNYEEIIHTFVGKEEQM
ncbi:MULTISPECIES: hypothetical protein [Bacillus]|uniref:hypothetical protein n=1 Tax=Bacillus TaxID=1386 RepID=UPI0001A12026|nr:hypothetical protein bcere0027_51930 [Bacillus cereus AH676]KMP63800.1 hypothetical protein TU56_13885 [Bacillus cereus]OJE01102.1 hypothetical protein A9485_22880 [Bacillus cereus]